MLAAEIPYQDVGPVSYDPPALRRKSNIWIGGPSQDLLLLVATPLLIIPLMTLARAQWSDMAIAVVVTTFGANAHHLPGLLRAYGDRTFFERYRTRLIVSPLALAAVCLTFGYLNIQGLVFVTLMWGVWHGMAQVYGLGRMYDAKVGLISEKTAYLDKAICIGWFGGGFLISESRLSVMLSELYKCGIPTVAPEAIVTLQVGWMSATVIASGVWALNQFHLSRTGVRSNPIKPLLFGSSFLFWWYAHVPIENAILGIAIFEVFHDVQYLTTVWIYNRKLVEKDVRLGPSLRLLFRPTLLCVALYVGFCWLYGFSGALGNSFLGEGNKAIPALLLTSGMLHFYFDSFLWNVREKSIRDDLDFSAESQTPGEPKSPVLLRGIPGGAWAYFIIPLVLLAAIQWRHSPTELEWNQSLANSLPTNELVLINLGQLLHNAGQDKAALEPIRKAAALYPRSMRTQIQLLAVTSALKLEGEAAEALHRITALGGEDPMFHVQMGDSVHQTSPATAARHYALALKLDPQSFEAHNNLASLLASQGNLQAAREHLVQASRISPTHVDAIDNLGIIEMRLGDLERAAKAFEAVLRLQPGHAGATKSLVVIRQRQDSLNEQAP